MLKAQIKTVKIKITPLIDKEINTNIKHWYLSFATNIYRRDHIIVASREDNAISYIHTVISIPGRAVIKFRNVWPKPFLS